MARKYQVLRNFDEIGSGVGATGPTGPTGVGATGPTGPTGPTAPKQLNYDASYRCFLVDD
mgnify:CR=1 FL=1